MKKFKKARGFPTGKAIIAALLIVMIGSGGYLFYRHSNSSKEHNTLAPTPVVQKQPVNGVESINYDPPSQEVKDETAQQKDEIIQKVENPPPPPTNLGASITRANQASPGKPLNIRTLITGTTNGTCEISLKKSGQTTVVKSFAIGVVGTYATCLDADVPVEAFTLNGDWTLELIAKNSGGQSSLISQTVTINK